MTIRANGRSALVLATGILATGLFVCFAGPSKAIEVADSQIPTVPTEASSAPGQPIVLKKYTKARHWKKYTHRKSTKVALKTSDGKKTFATDTAENDGDTTIAIPPWVANANAQLASADTTTAGSAKAMSARANEILQSAPDNPANALQSADVVSADQLNDVDRALRETTPAAPLMAMASAEAPAAPSPPVATKSGESSTWDQTSLIGKIFIAFGALLTMASAARMFMA
jgi:hypothetical protein